MPRDLVYYRREVHFVDECGVGGNIALCALCAVTFCTVAQLPRYVEKYIAVVVDLRHTLGKTFDYRVHVKHGVGGCINLVAVDKAQLVVAGNSTGGLWTGIGRETYIYHFILQAVCRHGDRRVRHEVLLKPHLILGFPV